MMGRTMGLLSYHNRNHNIAFQRYAELFMLSEKNNGLKLHENQTNMPKGCHKVRGLILRHLSIYVDMLRGDGSWWGYSG